MTADRASEQREGALVSNRIRELNDKPPLGDFDRAHLQAVHAYLFQDLPQHQPGKIRDDTVGWSKTRMLEGERSTHDVHYAHENIPARLDKILQDLQGPSTLATMAAQDVPARIARLYGDLDYAHSFHEGNSRTLREFTRSLVQAAGYELDWAPTGATTEQHNRLYVARDIAVLERAYPDLTPERGMETNDRYEFEASLALPALRRRGPTLEAIIREGLSPLPEVRQEAAHDVAHASSSKSIASLAIEALARLQHQASLPPDAQHTPIADRIASMNKAEPAAAPATAPEPKPRLGPSQRAGYEPGF